MPALFVDFKTLSGPQSPRPDAPGRPGEGPNSAILSAVIFNAIIIPLLIPIALKGVTYRPVGADVPC